MHSNDELSRHECAPLFGIGQLPDPIDRSVDGRPVARRRRLEGDSAGQPVWDRMYRMDKSASGEPKRLESQI